MSKKQFLIAFLFIPILLSAQEKSEGEFSGSFEINAQAYSEDTLINAPAVPEKMRSNAYANFNYSKDKFNFGLRYEAYLNSMLGYDEEYNGQGIAYRYASYFSDDIELTAGNFYEQFGNGLVLRTYEDKNLGYDNALDGFRVKYKPIEGLQFTGLIGKQKLFFHTGNGIVRGIDGNLSVNESLKFLQEKTTKVQLGASFVSKYEESNDPIYNLPENVGAGSGRISVTRKMFNLKAEYAYKGNDPSGDNLYDFEPEDGKNIKNPIFKDGQAFLVSTSWSSKQFGIVLTGMTLDNMSFRSERFASGNNLNINYLPAISKSFTYALEAMYPFSTQTGGQIGFSSDVFFRLKRNSLLGGKYGMFISLNYAQINGLIKTDIDIDPLLQAYTTNIFKPGEDVYSQDFNIDIEKKISKSFKFNLSYLHQLYNIEQIQGKTGEENIQANIFVLESTLKINKINAIRVEAQSLFSEQYTGNWAMGLIEYSFSRNWMLAFSDQYNYKNPHSELNIHYYNSYFIYNQDALRLQIGYGRQREGVICLGGVCRNLPASNGLSFGLTYSF